MSGSTYGKNFKITTWGESHGKALGVVIDGCPAGIPLTEEDFIFDLSRRKPGKSKYSTPRKEDDTPEILSGTFNGVTTGTPISVIVYNNNQKSSDYNELAEIFRPGHADYTFDAKYGIRDYRGGGRSSGRETVSRVIAGVVAKKILKEIGIDIYAYTYSIGKFSIDKTKFDKSYICQNPFALPDRNAEKEIAPFVDECMKSGDSSGGIVECIIENVPKGLGEPVFDKLSAGLAKAVFSMGAVKGVEFGLGFDASKILGSYNNDEFHFDESTGITKLTNNSGGLLGGISDGSPIVLKAAFKPTPSIFKTQNTVDKNNNNVSINIKGRHDPLIVPRAVVVVEAMCAVTLVDYLFMNMFSKVENIKSFYTR